MNFLERTFPYSPFQFGLWRTLFGAYLLYYAVAVFPYLTELYSSDGVYAEYPYQLPLPNILYVNDAPEVVLALGVVSVLAAIGILIGFWRQPAALVYWFVLYTFFGRNILTEDPSMAFVGLLLILIALIPSGEPLSVDGWRTRSSRQNTWRMPLLVYWTALIALGIGFTTSGIDKLNGLGWQAGDALYYMYQLGIAYDSWLVHLLQTQSTYLIAIETYAAAGAMLLNLPLLLIHRTRPYIWVVNVVMFLFVGLVFDLVQVVLGMLLFFFFLFDRQWLSPKQSTDRVVLLYDTKCNLCQQYVVFSKAEDYTKQIQYASIYDYAGENFDSIELRVGEKIYKNSDAVLEHFKYFGGIFRVVATAGLWIPQTWRDKVYTFVARHRYRWFGTCGSDRCEISSK